MTLKSTLLFFFIFGVCFWANSQIINKGDLKISSGTVLYFHEEYTNSTTGNHVSDGDFYLNNNFINNGETSAESGTTYFQSNENILLKITGDKKEVNFFNLEINVTSTNKKGVSVADNFLLNIVNAVGLTSGDLRLTGEAQLIQAHSGVNLNSSGSGKLLKDQQGTISPYAYDYWSSPVHNAGAFKLSGGAFDGTDSDINPFSPKPIKFNAGSPLNGLPSVIDGGNNVTTALTINKRWLYKYTQGSGSYSEWKPLKFDEALLPGEGYTMKGTNKAAGKQNYVFYGVPNSGDYNFSISKNQSMLLGNPYPSELDGVQFLNDNQLIFTSLHFWVDGGSTSHNLSDYMGGYATWNLTGGVKASIHSTMIGGIGKADTIAAPTRYIPVGKGFFVEATEGGGTIGFSNSQRFFTLPTPPVLERSAKNSEENKYIRLGFEDPEGFHRELLLGFLPDSPADLGVNRGYDAIHFSTRKDDMFFVIDGNPANRYVIQGVNRYSEFMEFPIGLILATSGAHQLMLDSVENFEDTVYLRDNLLDITHNLTDGKFEINLPAGEYIDRYSLVFQESGTLTTPDKDLDKTTVFYNGKNQIVVTNPKQMEIKSIDIYNVLGQHVVSYSENESHQTKIVVPFAESAGVYIVVLNTKNSRKSTKILKY